MIIVKTLNGTFKVKKYSDFFKWSMTQNGKKLLAIEEKNDLLRILEEKTVIFADEYGDMHIFPIRRIHGVEIPKNHDEDAITVI